MQKSLSENLAKLKLQLDKGNNLIDYFIICGVKPSTCLNENLYKFNNEDIRNIQLKPEILSKCPTFDKSIIKVDSEIIKFCFPNGFKIILNKKEPEPQFNSFILDNSLCSFNYPQKFISCLIFYESVQKYKKLKDKYDIDINSLNETSADSVNIISTNNENLKIPFSSRKNPYFKSRFYFIPKCICLISIYPYFNIHQQILYSLYQSAIFSSSQIPIEKIIENLIIEVPVPPKGLYKIEYLLFNKKLILKTNELNKIPSCNVKLEKIYKILGYDIIIEVIKHMYYENKILFFCKDLNILVQVLLSFISFIFPYKYPHQILSYLPKENYKTLESISPFMFGINEKFKDNFFENNDIEIFGSNFFIIDIEERKTRLFSNEEIPSFPINAKNLLDKDIKKFFTSIGNKIIPEDKYNYNLMKIFFDFHLEIIKDYENYLNEDYFKSNDDIQNANIYTLFKVDKFLKDYSNEKKFYEKFLTESNMLSELIYKRMIPKNNNEMIDILLIKDELIEKENKNKYFRKEKTNFISSNLYNCSNVYVVQKIRDISLKDIELISKDNSQNLLKAQEILIKKNKRINITYLLFPILNMDLFFNDDNINEYSPPPDFNEEIDLISTDIISKSYLGSYKIKKIEMKNYIYLTWLELWGFSFWYFDKKERKYRFNQLIKVLDKVIHHEMEIFNLLFDVLNKNKEEEMILKLYQKLIMLKLHPTTFIYKIINQLLDTNQIKELLNDDLINNKNKILYKNKIYQPTSFRKRTFKNKYETKVLTSQIRFSKYDQCIECQKLINLYNICTNFSNIKNDIMWVTCEKHHYNLPKLLIKFGKELNTEGNYFGIEGKTQTIYEVVLHSPHNIKINVKNGILREYGNQLDVDNFKMKFTPLFWNCIWYFKINNLDYDFILPYESRIENNIKYTNLNESRIKVHFVNRNELIKAKEKIENKKNKKKKSFKKNNLIVRNEINNYIKNINQRLRNYSFSTVNKSENFETETSFVNNNMIEGNINYDTMTKFSEIATSVLQENYTSIKFKNVIKPIYKSDNCINDNKNFFEHKEFEIDCENIKIDSDGDDEDNKIHRNNNNLTLDFFKVKNMIFNDYNDDNCKIYHLKRGKSYELNNSYEI